MRTLSVVLTLLVAVGFCFVGCSDQADIVAGANELAVSENQINLTKGSVVASVTGNAHLYVDEYNWPAGEKTKILRLLSFNAHAYADGSCAGEVTQSRNTIPGIIFKAEIRQVVVDGNKGKLVFESTRGGGEGLYCVTVVVDNGEGANAPMNDQGTIFLWYPPNSDWAQVFWEMSPNEVLNFVENFLGVSPPLVYIDIGNLQVSGQSGL